MEDISLIAAGGSGFDFVEFCIRGGVLALVLVLVFIAVVLLRKKFLANKGLAESENALTIEQIEEMHTKGMISDEEFAVMRRVVLGIGTPAEKSAKSEDDI